MNNLQDMPPKCQNCPYWEVAEEPYRCWDCFDDESSLEGKLEFTSEYVYTANPFVEFHLSNNQPILICLSKIIAIAKIIPNSEEGKTYLKNGTNTLICVIDDEIPVVESYEKVKELVGA